MMKVAYACVLTAVCAHEACPSSDPTCSAAEESALLQHAAKRHVKVGPSPYTLASTPLKSSSCVDETECRQDFVDKLSSSWKVDSTEPFLVGIGQKIFTLTPEVVTRNEWHQMDSTGTEGDTNHESTRELSTDLGIDASYYAFEGSAQLSVKALTSSKTASFFSKQFDSFVDFEMISDVLDPADVITPEAKKILTTWTVDQIHATLGDFYATKLSFGGTVAKSIVTTMYKDESTASLSSSMKAAYGKAFLSGEVKASFSGSTSFSDEGHNFTMRTAVNGGDELLWISDLKSDCSNYETVKHEWGKAMTMDTMIPVRFALQPLWRLIEHTDSAKSEELKEYMLAQWKRGVEILPYDDTTLRWTKLGDGECNIDPFPKMPPWASLDDGKLYALDDCKSLCANWSPKDWSPEKVLRFAPNCRYITWKDSKCTVWSNYSKCDEKYLVGDTGEETWQLHKA